MTIFGSYARVRGLTANVLWQAMIQKINSDAKEISDLVLDLDDQKKSRVEYQTMAMSYENELKRWRSRLVRSALPSYTS